MATKQQFSVDLSVGETFLVDDIWPDGGAPDNPTVDDVRRALFYDGEKPLTGSRLLTRLEDIGVLDRLAVSDLTITDGTAFVERMLKLGAMPG